MNELVQKAKEWAFARHGETGIIYDGLPYAESHLTWVVEEGARLGYTEETDPEMVAALWLHDTIEDTVQGLRAQVGNYRWMAGVFSPRTAELVWAVTGVGETRKERNATIYMKIAVFPEAAIPKTIDRIVNMKRSEPGSKHWRMYNDELPRFLDEIVYYAPLHVQQAFIDMLIAQRFDIPENWRQDAVV